jgi:hypothetical protein
MFTKLGNGEFYFHYFLVVVVSYEKKKFEEEALRVVKNYCHVMTPME